VSDDDYDQDGPCCHPQGSTSTLFRR
jgi:hypothetical protein